MRVAWFHPEPVRPAIDASDAVDLALELGAAHTIDQFDARRAHDFVWQHFTTPYDLTIYELGDSAAYAFVWPYIFHDPGVLVVRAQSLHHGRSDALLRARRHHHLRAERAFAGWDLLRAPLAASRLVVVHDVAVARSLSERFPDVAIRVVPAGVAAATLSPGSSSRFVVAGPRGDVTDRAARRAREAGAPVETGLVTADGLHANDVLIALEWPPTGAPPPAALRAMSAGIPAIVLETEAVAAWPTLDPQTWQPRAYLRGMAPIGVSLDPRDEEHSLMLAMRRLSTDVALRASLGAAACAWAREHASLPKAAEAWNEVFREAIQRTPPSGMGVLPPHLTEDGTAAARRILDEYSVTIDFL